MKMILFQMTHLLLSVHADLEEQLEVEAIRQQEAVSLRQEKEAVFQQETSSFRESSEDFASEEVAADSMTLPPPEWPESPLGDDIPVAE